jgi:hypothetical protein
VLQTSSVEVRLSSNRLNPVLDAQTRRMPFGLAHMRTSIPESHKVLECVSATAGGARRVLAWATCPIPDPGDSAREPVPMTPCVLPPEEADGGGREGERGAT